MYAVIYRINKIIIILDKSNFSNDLQLVNELCKGIISSEVRLLEDRFNSLK